MGPREIKLFERRQTMKILVIDDSRLHQQAARQTLEGHEFTIATTYDEAHKLLQEPCASWDAVEEELKRHGFKESYDRNASAEESAATWAERQRLEVELCPAPSFDIVLSDLLMPASKMTMGDKGMEYV